MRAHFMICNAMVALWLATSATAVAAQEFGPASGERLVYNIHWMGAPGGKAVLEFFHLDESRYRILMTLESIGLVDLIHNIRDRFEATGLLTASGPISSRYSKLVRNGNKEKKMELVFNRQEGYVERLGTEGQLEERVADVAVEVNDPLSAIYGMRQQELKVGDGLKRGLMEGKRRYQSTAQVTDGGAMFGPLGWYDVLEISPTLEPSELFNDPGNMVIWLSKDTRRLPIRIKSRIRVGSIQADLVAFDDGRGERRELDQPGR